MNLIALLARNAETRAKALAMTFLDEMGREAGQLTWQALKTRTLDVAEAVASLRNERALLVCDPGLDFMPALLGCMSAGVTVVPLPPMDANRADAQRDYVQRVIADAEATAILASGKSYEVLADLDLGLPCHDLAATPSGTGTLTEPDVDAVVGLLYTSGSTAAPKAVPLRHRHLAYNAQTCCDAWEIDETSRVISWMPNQHSFGLVYNVLIPLYSGAHLIGMAPSSFVNTPRLWFEAFSRYGGTHGAAATFGYQLCAEKVDPSSLEGLDLSSWRVGLISAEPVRRGVCDAFMKRFGHLGLPEQFFCALYGLSESGPITTQAPATAMDYDLRDDAPEELALARLGKALPGTMIRVVDPVRCVEVGDGESGEVWVSGPSVLDGYWRREETNAACFARLPEHDAPFFRTGDQGFLRDGVLTLNGRIKEIIIARGKNYYPQDIEQVARESDAIFGSGSAAAFADEVSGAVTLVLEVADAPAEPAQHTRHVVQTVLATLGLQLARVVIASAGTVQKTASGKVRRAATAQALHALAPIFDWQRGAALHGAGQRDAAQAPAARDGSAQDRAAQDGSPLERLTALFAQTAALDASEVEPDIPIDEYDLDSLAFVEIADAISRQFNVSFEATLFYKYETLGEIAEYLEAAP